MMPRPMNAVRKIFLRYRAASSAPTKALLQWFVAYDARSRLSSPMERAIISRMISELPA